MEDFFFFFWQFHPDSILFLCYSLSKLLFLGLFAHLFVLVEMGLSCRYKQYQTEIANRK